MVKQRLKHRLRRLWEKDPRCHWCGKPTFLILTPPGVDFNIGKQHPKMATIDHLRSRYDSTRKERSPEDNEPRTVLACHACNDKRNEEEQAQVPTEERSRRSRYLNRKRHRKRKKWKEKLSTYFTERMVLPFHHEEFNKQVRHLHFLANRGVSLIRDKSEESNEAEEELQEIAAEIYLALTGRKIMNCSITSDGIVLGDEILQPSEAQALAWKLLHAAHSLHSERKYEGCSGDLEDFLKANPPKGDFKPYAFYNIDGNQLEVFWEDEQDYGQETKNHAMCIHRSQEDHRVVGVTIYGIQQVMSIEKDGPNPDNRTIT